MKQNENNQENNNQENSNKFIGKDGKLSAYQNGEELELTGVTDSVFGNFFLGKEK